MDTRGLAALAAGTFRRRLARRHGCPSWDCLGVLRPPIREEEIASPVLMLRQRRRKTDRVRWGSRNRRRRPNVAQPFRPPSKACLRPLLRAAPAGGARNAQNRFNASAFGPTWPSRFGLRQVHVRRKPVEAHRPSNSTFCSRPGRARPGRVVARESVLDPEAGRRRRHRRLPPPRCFTFPNFTAELGR